LNDEHGDGRTKAERWVIACNGESVASHLGSCGSFALFESSDGSAVRLKEMDNPGLSPGFMLVFFLQHRIGTVIAGNLGSGLCALLEANGIGVVRGVEGTVDEVGQAFGAGTLVGGDIPCTRHDQCVGCGNCQ
jgi:predicted Fe-Mo cluster-binding NifX family protein